MKHSYFVHNMSYFVHLEGMSVGKWPEFFMNPKSSLSHKRKMDKNCRVKKVNKKVITTHMHSSYNICITSLKQQL